MTAEKQSLEIAVNLEELPEEGKMMHVVYVIRKRKIYRADRLCRGLSSFVPKGNYRMHLTRSRTHGTYITMLHEATDEGFLLLDTVAVLAELCQAFGPPGSVSHRVIHSMIIESSKSKQALYINFL